MTNLFNPFQKNLSQLMSQQAEQSLNGIQSSLQGIADARQRINQASSALAAGLFDTVPDAPLHSGAAHSLQARQQAMGSTLDAVLGRMQEQVVHDHDAIQRRQNAMRAFQLQQARALYEARQQAPHNTDAGDGADPAADVIDVQAKPLADPPTT